MDFLRRMRAEPQYVKGRYAFLGALAFTFVVTLIWSLSVPARFSKLDTPPESLSNNDGRGALTEIIDTARLQFANVIDVVENNPLEPAIQDNGESPAYTTLPPASEMQVSAPSNYGAESMAREESKPEPRIVLIGTTTSKMTKDTD